MRCHDCRRTTTPEDSAIRGRYVASNRWGVKVGYREFRRIRLCRECMGEMGWRHAVEQGAVAAPVRGSR